MEPCTSILPFSLWVCGGVCGGVGEQVLPLQDTQRPTGTSSGREGWGVTSPIRSVGFLFLYLKMLASALEPTYTEYGWGTALLSGSSGMLSILPVLHPAKLCGQPWALRGEAAWFSLV